MQRRFEGVSPKTGLHRFYRTSYSVPSLTLLSFTLTPRAFWVLLILGIIEPP
ncbi:MULTISPECIES: hypothetical protein [unclassified Moorena]|uniref:hypothetical protein n=1 Tax=unclassified Moorena TaxID=2683338 RepID=UPI00140172D7|nr:MULTISPECIES: hypothetical protein [unclassified Moorena]NEQ03977.1 hypothetical protein [Moorena sp. SIO3F7]